MYVTWRDGVRKWRCPACDSLMGLTRPGQWVFCSWSDEPNRPACSSYGYGYHPTRGEMDRRRQQTQGDERGRLWTMGEQQPNRG